MTWLPICLFLALCAQNAKLEPEIINRLPRDADPDSTSTTVATPTTASTTSEASTTASTTAEASTTASTATSTSEASTTASTTEASTTSTTTSPSSESSKKDGDECDAESLNNIVCENDKLIFCGPNNQIMSVPCVVNGKQGFCNCEKTGCVKEKPVCPGDKTKCYQPNTKLPDNLDCHKFTYCNQNKEKLTFQCEGNLIYNMTAEKCLDSHSARCHKVACPRPGKTLQLMPFPQAKNFYVLCYNGMGDVRKCQDKYYAVVKNTCQFDCNLKRASGMFRDTNLEKCKKGYYYACRRAGSNYVTVEARCQKGEMFDEDIGLCTEEDTCTENEPESV